MKYETRFRILTLGASAAALLVDGAIFPEEAAWILALSANALNVSVQALTLALSARYETSPFTKVMKGVGIATGLAASVANGIRSIESPANKVTSLLTAGAGLFASLGGTAALVGGIKKDPEARQRITPSSPAANLSLTNSGL